jgi:hypothetical protein
VPDREQVLRLVAEGVQYEEIGRRLGIAPGQAYLIGTGIPADGGDTVTHAQRDRPGMLSSHSQRLVNPRTTNPTGRQDVREWIRWRVSTDLPMRQAAELRQARQTSEEE